MKRKTPTSSVSRKRLKPDAHELPAQLTQPNALDTHKTIKASLKNIVRNDDVAFKLQQAAMEVHTVTTQALFFLKLYLVHVYDTNPTYDFSSIDKQFIVTILKLFTITQNKSVNMKPANAARRDTLRQFYSDHYTVLYSSDKRVPYQRYMDNTFEYMATSIMTMYTNNIQTHFYDHVRKFVSVLFNKRQRLDEIHKSTTLEVGERKRLVRALHVDLGRVVGDLLAPNAEILKTSPPQYHTWIDAQRPYILPQRPLDHDNFKYDIQCKPWDYLKGMIYMSKAVETHLATVDEQYREKMLSVFPLRTSVAPKYFTLDTRSLARLMLSLRDANKFVNGGASDQAVKLALWSTFFKVHKRCFTSSTHTFDCMIETDGVGVSVLLRRNDLLGKRLGSPKKIKTGELYIDEIGGSDMTRFKGRTLVAIDPNMGDLLYCINDSVQSPAQTKFRYTQNQRRKECKTKKYRDIITDSKPQDVLDSERALSVLNHKTVAFESFKTYTQAKNRALAAALQEFYSKPLFRKLKFSAHVRRKMSEQKLINNFEEKFGAPVQTVVAIGDFEQRNHRKFHEPVKGKGFRGLLRKAGYAVFLVDEFKTSCMCSACGDSDARTETFRKTKDPRAWKKNRARVVHGLVRCKTCARLWNRDVNAACNIHKIAKAALDSLPRPPYMQR